MPKLRNSIPKYAKHRGSGQAIVTLNGREYYLGPHGSKASRIAYDRVVAEWLANDRRPESDPDSITVVELVAAFLKWAKGHYRKQSGRPTGTIENYILAFRILRSHYGNTLAAEFGPKSLKAIQLLLVGEGLSRRTINDRCSAIRKMFRWAVSEELIAASVHQGLATVAGLQRGRTKAKEPLPIRPVDDVRVDAAVGRLPEVVADMVRLQQLTGMRPAEICLVRPADVDTNGEVWLFEPETHKTEHHGHSRVIAIGPKGQDVLRKYLLRESSSYCFRPRDSEKRRLRERTAARVTPWSCGNKPGTNKKKKPLMRPGERYSTDSYRRAIKRACDLAKVKKWSPNQLRHSAATKIRSQFGLEAAQVTLGHSRADVTQVYAERDMQKAIDVARQVG